ncbi:hypothetical protein D3C81_1260970 [compost metagenome]
MDRNELAADAAVSKRVQRFVPGQRRQLAQVLRIAVSVFIDKFLKLRFEFGYTFHSVLHILRLARQGNHFVLQALNRLVFVGYHRFESQGLLL